MWNRPWFKKLAKDQMQGNLAMLFVVTLLVNIIAGVISSIIGAIAGFILGLGGAGSVALAGATEEGAAAIPGLLLTFFLTFAVMLVGYALISPIIVANQKIYLNLTEGEKPDISVLFSFFSNLKECAILLLLIAVKTFLWSLLFYIPGIIAALRYSQAFYILADNPGMTAVEAIEESKRMTDGHKMDLFITGLSFIGWALLGSLTFGILTIIYVLPYQNATFANCYRFLKDQTYGS
ncbi:MAG: DUF975 family protein [Ruminococcus sp.]|jgi:uncharacterized membrane protein|nr:DUF975 family protein [Ruminococcus sp.]